jgi:uncharacterized protein YegL
MTDKPPLFVVCDTSGSMSEGGKRMLVRNLLTYLHQFARMCPAVAPTWSLRVIAWGEATEVVEVEGEILPFRCVGKTSADSLAILLTTHLENVSQPRLLLISDGQWHRDELTRLVQWRRSMSNVSVRVIATGYDANVQHLRQLAGASAVFNPEEIVAALHSWDGEDSAMLNQESRVPSFVEMGGGS